MDDELIGAAGPPTTCPPGRIRRCRGVPGSRTPAPSRTARALLAVLGLALLLMAVYGGRMTQFAFLDTGTERFREALPGLVWAAALGVAGGVCLRLAVGRGPWVLWLLAGAVPAVWEAALHLGA